MSIVNNFRAGLYSFAPTTTWLRETGMASPPFLVVLALTLPDSRILSGIAGVGLSLANIAIILPHLRQPILDSVHANECRLTSEQSTQEQTRCFSHTSITTQPVDLKLEVLALVSTCEGELQSAPLTCSATVKSVCSAFTEPLECLGFDSAVALPPHRIHLSPSTDSIEKPNSSSNPFMREGRSADHIPLPAPDAAEVAFFDTMEAFLSDCNLEKTFDVREQHSDSEEDSSIEEDAIAMTGDQLDIINLPNTPEPGEPEVLTDLAAACLPLNLSAGQPVAGENAVPVVAVQNNDNPVAEDTSHLPDDLVHVILGEKEEVLTKRRPESLKFIPQSVIRRHPSVPMSPARCFGHRVFSSGHDQRFTPAQLHTLVYNPITVPGATASQSSYTPSGGHWCATFLAQVQPDRRSMKGQALVLGTVPFQDSLIQGPTPLPTVKEPIPLKKYPTHTPRLGVLARPGLRNRRSAIRRTMSNGIDNSFASDSDSDSDDDSQYSGGSSTDDMMLPHILGADLIAAIDANSESELNLAGAKRTIRNPLDGHENFLASEDSVADVSMIMHVSCNGAALDGEVKAPVTHRSLTYEDIQEWASGVVQKCVRQVCRNRAPVEPSSPSQASDVCAERPSGSGKSQCPLSGLHCRLGATTSAQVPTPRSREPPGRKPLSIRNFHDIPEFVPRGRVEHHWQPTAMSTIAVTRDAATEVITRMENQAGFNTRQWLTDRTRKVSTGRGCQGAPRRG